MNTSPASFLRVMPAVSPLAMMIALAACGGPDFTAGAAPHGEVAHAEAGDDVDNTPIILPPDSTGTTEEGDDGGDGPIEAGGGDATREGGGGNAGDASGSDASGRGDASGSGDATIEGRGDDATAETSGASGDGAASHDGGDAFAADSREETPAILIDAAPRAGDAGCDPTHAPKDDASVVADTYGVFVSTSGLDTAAGSMSDPLKTITEGIAKATQLGKSRVYVCRGNYAEQVVLDAAHDGMGLYGGLDCASGWTWTGDKAQVLGPSALYALRVDTTTKAVVIEDMGFSVPDASGQDTAGNGNSSVAAFVSNTAGDGVSFVRVALRAGAGADGSAGGVPATNWYSADAGDLAGNGGAAGRQTTGASGTAKDCSCKSWGDTVGGAGSPAVNGVGSPGSATPAATPDVQDGLDGHGGSSFTSPALAACTPGGTGANGTAQSGGGLPASSTGTPNSAGWATVSGSDGDPGDPGQGGGGGGGGLVGGQGGDQPGGGGCGGCGGAGGLGGGSGGASVALLVYAAAVSVQGLQLVTSMGGQGGAG
ncbi:MAG TPA: hypothetical protein VN894_01845, partial [Polyangiaceae bacterium]|nr:hypothetical protein [Polyangiaceae bacterium]